MWVYGDGPLRSWFESTGLSLAAMIDFWPVRAQAASSALQVLASGTNGQRYNKQCDLGGSAAPDHVQILGNFNLI